MAKSAKTDTPNVLFIMADDIGWFNISCNNNGITRYRTPNIDRIAREGGIFTDFYGQQSCTAGRASFITGQSPIRTGLTKVGLPGAKAGLDFEDPSIGQFMKHFGYATGVSSARTISAIATKPCRRCTASTSSLATSITSMPRKSPRTRTIPMTLISANGLALAASSSCRRLDTLLN